MMHRHGKNRQSPAATSLLPPHRKKERVKRKMGITFFLRLVFVVLLMAVLLALFCLPSGEVRQQHPLSAFSRPLNPSEQQPTTSTKKPNYHIVFSTSCSPQQHWESYVLFYFAWKVNQSGNVTRLLSGCGNDDRTRQEDFFYKHIRTLSPNFHVHFTPDFGKVQHHENQGETERYKYMNKPFSLKHWMENVLGYSDENGSTKYDNDIVFLIDPDMILLKPLTHDFRSDPVVEFMGSPDENHRVVRHGHPMAQQDGYLNSKWLTLNLTSITNDSKSPVLQLTREDGPKHWNSGPPYIFTAKDGYALARKWVVFAPRVFSQYPQLFAEMFGFIIASAHLELKHTLIKSLVVSTTTTREREGWKFVDDLSQVCPHPPHYDIFALHYCKRYLLGRRWFWSKYRLRKDFMDCQVPLQEEPDPSIQNERDFYFPPPVHSYRGVWKQEHKVITEKQAKREAFMLCGMIPMVNEAVGYYKRRACGENGNFSKVYNVHDDPG